MYALTMVDGLHTPLATDCCSTSLNHPQYTFTLKMATAVVAEVLENLRVQ
jgi:hypothetical protein